MAWVWVLSAGLVGLAVGSGLADGDPPTPGRFVGHLLPNAPLLRRPDRPSRPGPGFLLGPAARTVPAMPSPPPAA